jgi:hypothetical protein
MSDIGCLCPHPSQAHLPSSHFIGPRHSLHLAVSAGNSFPQLEQAIIGISITSSSIRVLFFAIYWSQYSIFRASFQVRRSSPY